MPIVSNFALNADLMNGVMKRLGRAALGPDDIPNPVRAQKLREMIYRCAACSDQSGCAALQATVMKLESPPLFCRNADALMGLPKA